MKQLNLLIITLLMCACAFVGCRRDRIDHEDTIHIYVWKYSLNGDSTLKMYHQPIYYKCPVVDRKRTTRRRRAGKTYHTSHRYYTYYYRGGEKLSWSSYSVYNNAEVGDTLSFKEWFYPYHGTDVIEVIKKR